jgi:hypothetical protein
VAGAFEHCNETSVNLKAGEHEYLDYVNDLSASQRLKKSFYHSIVGC